MKLVVPVLTKFDENGKLVLDREYSKFIDSLIENGVDILMPCGTNSEFHVMDLEERKNVVEFVFENFKEKVEIMPHVGCASFKDTLKLADHAFSLGADIVSIVAPYYFKYDRMSIEEYFVSIAKEFSDKKILLYNIPSFTGNRLEFDTILNIREKAPNVVGLKDTDSRPWIVTKLKKEIPDFTVYGGLDTFALDYAVRGGDGQVSGTANVFPKLLRKLLDGVRRGNVEEASKYQRILDTVVEKISGHVAFVGANKYVLRRFGFDLGHPRSPNRDLTEDEKEDIEKALPEYEKFAM